MSRVTRGCTIIVLFLMMLVLSVSTGVAAEKQRATYTAPDGMEIISFSPNWTDAKKLQAIHDELLSNGHGKEIELLERIEIYDGYPHGKGVAGQYVFQAFGTIFSSKQKMQPGKIELYGGSEHKTVESFAHTLAHEYGHHVTHYYTLKVDGFLLTDEDRWHKTTYAKMRGLSKDERISVEDGEHRWQVAEVAAEDYLQLFGSPLAKAHTPFASRVDQALNGEDPAVVSWNGSMYNVQPQENHELPLASEVPGLYQFFHKLMKGTEGKFTPPAKPGLTLASFSKQGDVGYQLRFTWDIPDEQANYSYTLVTYGDDDHLAEPVVTRTSADTKEARYGPVIVRKGPVIYTYQEPHTTGTRHFKLFVFGDNGWVSDSAVLTVDLRNPSQVTINDNEVIPVTEVEGTVLPEQYLELTALEEWIGNLELDIDLSWLQGVIDFLDSAIQVVGDVIEWLIPG